MSAFASTLKEIEQRREAIQNALMGGVARDFAEYKYMTGEIRGLSLAHSLITDLVRKLENDDE